MIVCILLLHWVNPIECSKPLMITNSYVLLPLPIQSWQMLDITILFATCPYI